MDNSVIPTASMALAMAFSLIHCPVILAVAESFGWYDPTSPRKLHHEPVPRLGGIAIFGAFALALLVMALRGQSPQEATHGQISLWPFLIGAFLIHIMGVLDDFQDLRARHKLGIEICAALLLVSTGFRFHGMHVPWSETPISFGALSYPISMLWIIGVTNALNLLDGMDGLAATVGALAAATFGTLFLLHGNVSGACLAFALCGALLGFLWFNWNPARLFMGDGGSLMVGFVLACLPLISQADGSLEIGFIASTVVLALPILDTMHVMLERKRTGRPIMSADREHIHHHMLALGFGPKGSLVLLGGSTLALCLTTIAASFFGPALSFTTKIGALAFLALCIRAIHLMATRRKPAPVHARRG